MLLLVVAVVAYWPTWAFEGWYGTENRRVEIAREMLANDDVWRPTLGLEPTVAKPPLFYQSVALAFAWFGESRFAARAPSILSMWLVAWLAFALLRRTHDALAGWIGGLGILCSPALLYHGAYAEIDPMFAALTAASIWLLGHGVAFERRVVVVAAGVIGGLAMMTKGPPFVLFLLGPLFVWHRRRRLRGGIVLYLPLVIAPLLVWYYTVAPADTGSSVEEETLGRLAYYEWKHIVDIPLYFMRVGLILLPFGLWAFAEYRGAHEARALANAELQQRFSAAAVLGAVLLFAVFPGKPVRYVLPAVVLFIFTVAPNVAGFLRFPAPVGPVPLRIVRGLGVFGAVALCVLPFVPFPLPGRSVVFAGVLAAAPLVVHTRVRILAYALAVPVLANWTVLDDRARVYEHGIRSTEDVRVLLEEELERNEATDVSTYGHFNYAHLFGIERILPGDEFMRRQPASEWVLVEHRGGHQPRANGYVDRVSIRARRRSIVLQQRAP